MRGSLRILALFCVPCTAAVLLVPQPVSACSISTCEHKEHFLPTDGTVVPANLQGIFVTDTTLVDYGDPRAKDQELFVVEDGQAVQEVAHEFVEQAGLRQGYALQFEESLNAGVELEFRSEDRCTEEESTFTFTLTDAADIPETLGHLEVVETKTSSIDFGGGASCKTNFRAAQAEILLHLDENAEPWRDVLWYQTFVNGQPWFASNTLGQDIPGGSSWIGRGKDLLVASCGDEGAGLSEGTHTVEMRAYLPGVDEPISTESIEVDLECSSRMGCGCATTDAARRNGTLWFVLLGGLLIALQRRFHRTRLGATTRA